MSRIQCDPFLLQKMLMKKHWSSDFKLPSNGHIAAYFLRKLFKSTLFKQLYKSSTVSTGELLFPAAKLL